MTGPLCPGDGDLTSMRKVLWLRWVALTPSPTSYALKGAMGLPVTGPIRFGSARYFLPVPGSAVVAPAIRSYQGSVPSGADARSGTGGTSPAPAAGDGSRNGPRSVAPSVHSKVLMQARPTSLVSKIRSPAHGRFGMNMRWRAKVI